MDTSTRILALDLSSSTGYAVLEVAGTETYLVDYGTIRIPAKDFNVNDFPNKSELYPYNIVDAADEMACNIRQIIENENVEKIVIENTVRGRNRHTQRLLEFIHKSVLDVIQDRRDKVTYLDPSEWRKILSLRLSAEDKKHNAMVKKKLAKGKITHKHLSVRMSNELFDLELKLKDNDIADAVLLGYAYLVSNNI